MAAIVLRLTKALPLTNAEIDANFTNLNTELGALGASYNPNNVLSKLLTVDGAGSLLDADLLDGLNTASAATVSTVVIRDAFGNFGANEITASKFIGDFDVATLKKVTFEGSTADDFETTLTVVNPTADRIISLPDITGTVVTTGDTETVTNTMLTGSITNAKLSNSSITIDGNAVSLGGTLSLGLAPLSGTNTWTGIQTFSDNKFVITDNTDITKKVIFEVADVSTATTRTLTIPNTTGTIATTTFVNTGAALTAGTINTISVTSIGTNSIGTKTVSTLAPSGGVSGDVWYRV